MFNRIWRFQRILRRAEYYTNCRKGMIWQPLVFLMQYRLSRYGFKLGYEIPPNCFGPGLSIAHQGSIIVNRYAVIGENCRINNGVTIGTEAGFTDKCPTIGKNAFIGTGAQIFGTITHRRQRGDRSERSGDQVVRAERHFYSWCAGGEDIR